MTKRRRLRTLGAALATLALSASACSSTAPRQAGSAPASSPASSSTAPGTGSTAPSFGVSAASAVPTATAPASSSPPPGTRSPSAPSSASRSAGSTPAARTGAPVIVLDPGHALTTHAVDKRTRLRVDDYENEPEMRDVYAVAQSVATQLRAAGYRVVLTKTSDRQHTTLAQRAAVANRVHAALALSIHDQAGADGGIGFRSGNNTVYYQAVGDYRTNVDGRRIHFTSTKIAALSKKYAQRFAAQRHRVQGVPITTRGNIGYDAGSRGLAAGNIWIVQLLSKVPWIYNEAGGNSRGRVGLNAADKATYAKSLVASVEACVPRPKR